MKITALNLVGITLLSLSKSELFSLLITIISMAILAILFTMFFAYYAKKEKKAVEDADRDIEIIDEAIDKRIHKKRKKALKIAGNALFILALLIMIPTLIYGFISRFGGSHQMIGDVSLLVVASGSMSQKNPANPYLEENNLNDQFQTYDVLLIHKVKNQSDIKKYDVIAYYDTSKQETIIHRVIEVDVDDNGSYKYTTRGDANNATDTTQPSFSDVIGKYTGQKADKIGAFVLFLQSGNGIITIATLIYSLFMAEHYMGAIADDKNKREKKLFSYIDLPREESPSSYNEEIHYKGYLYRFSESGFISKEEEENVVSSSILKRVIKIGDKESSTEYDLSK